VPDPGNCSNLASLLGGTLFANLVGCLSELIGYTTKLPATSLQVIALSLTNNLPNSGITNNIAYTACCQFRQAVLTLFNSSNSITRCGAVKAFEAAACPTLPSQQVGDSDPQYLTAIQTSIQATVLALFEAFRECICHDLLPPCPADPTDDRLILACLTIQDGEIVDICNFGCRQFAGGFPSFFYWLSAVPIVPIIKWFVDALCCGTVTPRDDDQQNEPAVMKRQASLQSVIMDSNFALPKMFAQRFGDLAQKFSPETLVSSIPAGGVNLATLNGMSASNASAALKANKVSFETKMVNSRGDIPFSTRIFTLFANPGDHVVLYQSNDKIVGAEAAPASASVSPDAIANLQSEVESLRAEINAMKKNAAPLKKK
jgi:hypothetical protein